VSAPEYVTVAEAAAALGVTDVTIRTYFDTGRLSGLVLPSGHRRITRESLEAAKAERGQA
jgi:excisionase family DNA binding protein